MCDGKKKFVKGWNEGGEGSGEGFWEILKELFMREGK